MLPSLCVYSSITNMQKQMKWSEFDVIEGSIFALKEFFFDKIEFKFHRVLLNCKNYAEYFWKKMIQTLKIFDVLNFYTDKKTHWVNNTVYQTIMHRQHN